MTIDELLEHIKGNDFWDGTVMPAGQVEQLAALAPGEYAQVVLALLREPLGDSTGLRGLGYRNTYVHRLYGCLLFLLRPNPDLYPDVLAGALGIPDPSDIQYAAAALLKVRPAEQVALDLLAAIAKYKDDDETLAHIFDLFYWVGFTAGSLLRRHVTISLSDTMLPLLIENTPPKADPQRVGEVAYQIAENMLELFEHQDTGPAARSCIGLLTCGNISAFPSVLRTRIIRAYARAASSPDAYIRNRVSAPGTVALIRSL